MAAHPRPLWARIPGRGRRPHRPGGPVGPGHAPVVPGSGRAGHRPGTAPADPHPGQPRAPGRSRSQPPGGGVRRQRRPQRAARPPAPAGPSRGRRMVVLGGRGRLGAGTEVRLELLAYLVAAPYVLPWYLGWVLPVLALGEDDFSVALGSGSAGLRLLVSTDRAGSTGAAHLVLHTMAW